MVFRSTLLYFFTVSCLHSGKYKSSSYSILWVKVDLDDILLSSNCCYFLSVACGWVDVEWPRFYTPLFSNSTRTWLSLDSEMDKEVRGLIFILAQEVAVFASRVLTPTLPSISIPFKSEPFSFKFTWFPPFSIFVLMLHLVSGMVVVVAGFFFPWTRRGGGLGKEKVRASQG